MFNHIFILIIILFSTVSCSNEIDPIRFGFDSCDHCKMLIMDPKFGGVILTKKGKSFKFDDTNCMVSYLKNNIQDENQISSVSTIDYNKPETLIDATKAVYILSTEIKSPMASGIASFSSHESLPEFMRQYNGASLTWDAVKPNVK